MDFRALLAGVTFAFIWASAFTSARVIVADAPPFLALSLRFAISGGLGIGLAMLLGQTMRLTGRQWALVVVFGVMQNGVYLGLNFWAMQMIEASLAAIIASTMPLIVAFMLWLGDGERLSKSGMAGLLAGVVGVTVIMGARFSGDIALIGVLACVAAVIALSIATLVLRGAGSGGNLLMIVGLQMVVASLGLLPVGMVAETWDVAWTPRLAFAFGYTALFPGLVATVIWFWLVQRIGATRAATYHFLTPPFGVLIAALFLGERVGWADFIGVAIIAGGIYAVQRARAKAI